MTMDKDPLFIVLADDDDADRLLFTKAFSELKIDTIVQTVDNGAELMKWLNEEHAHLPHLIFLDLNMPRKNGIQCLREIRSNKRLNHIFIAVYSTSNSKKDMQETFLNGANIFIHKPTDFKILKQVLEKAVMTTNQYQKEGMKKENFLLRI